MQPTGILTVDLEDWYHGNYDGLDTSSSLEELESHVVAYTDILLDVFRRHACKATFFTLGVVAENHPALIRAIVEEGHEIACHGYGHTRVSDLGPEGFRDDLRKAKQAIYQACGQEPRGFRAPSWSISPSRWHAEDQAMWPLHVLAQEGFIYDASLFPFKTYLYGVKGAPTVPHRLELGGDDSIIELPASVVTLGGRRWPFGGGFYFRALPLPVTCFLYRRYTKANAMPFMYYIHPREVSADQPRLKLNFKESLIHHFNLKRNKHKLEGLLARFPFTTAREFLETQGSSLRIYRDAGTVYHT